ncbi:DUF3545 family protein [Shewanella yunxiaonensis]|uniref:DUF3545 family protein n=1 Tax=Shewanella yunxiaonensis TaxID=2829809 RepID=A0ABX7YX95_9GAMM|nr:MULTISPECIES: DUF3545 family protein [Shewanella]MDF0532905.1 DUF3545 family protein [Shewanella sp. A32]QUN06786.1 DUF3545 family protein [Shewanella yunxiaonensis]
MDQLDYGSALDLVEERPSRSRNSKKRKWREIEALKEKHRLMRELKEIDSSFDADLETLLI